MGTATISGKTIKKSNLSDFKSDRLKSQEYLYKYMMNKYKLTESDLEDIDIVKKKIRDTNIEEVIKM